MRSTLDYFNCQLRRRGGVISVWGAGNDDDTSGASGDDVDRQLVNIMYRGIINRLKEFDGIEFERHSWVDVPDPFNLKVFAQRLFLNFYSDNIRACEIMEVGKKGEAGLIERCRRFLFEEDCLVVINGLRCRDDWDRIERTFLLSSSEPSRTTKGCILVVTYEEAVATHCVKDDHAAALSVKDLKADPAIVNLIEKGTWYCELEGCEKGRLFYDRRNDANQWTNSVHGHRRYTRDLLHGKSGLVTVSGKIAAVRLKAFLRSAYYEDGLDYCGQKLRHRSWVDVPVNPHQFSPMDLCWRLLLDFHSDDIRAKEAAAVGLMEGTLDPIEECRKLLREEAGYLVVIYGRRCIKGHWCFISNVLLSEHIQGTIIVDATNDLVGPCPCMSVATHCNPTNRIEAKHVPYNDATTEEYSRLFWYTSERWRKAVKECIEEFQLVGSQMEENHLGKLVRDNKVVSVWGIAGVGKSSLVTKVYYKNIFYGHNYHKQFGWVDVPDPFNLTQLCCRLLVDFYSNDPQAKETAAVGLIEGSLDPIQECCKFIHKQKCLVVIDGLRSTQDWDLIKATLSLPERNSDTTIVVITSAEKVAMHCVQNVQDKVLNIRRLEADAALDLLARKIASDDKPLTSEETEISKSIVAKCGGLPKVITAVGEACSFHLRRLRTDSSYRYCMWPPGGNFIRDLETKPEFRGLRPLFSWMQSYFDACSDSIKPCIFYLSIFPPAEKKNIRQRRLLWRWIAEGYCRDTSDGRTCEENGAKFVSELVNLSIIQHSPSNKVFCQINGFFHEYIMSRPMEDNLVFALEGRCSLNSQRVGQHLAIRSSWDRRDRAVYESIDFSRLRSLTVAGKWESFFVSSKNINMRLLRVLDLEDAIGVTNDDLVQIGKLLRRLKFLSLRGCREITWLPSSIGGLRQLQTLDIRHTSIVTLPPVVTKLQKLQYIRAGTTEVWDWNEGIEEDRGASSSPQVTNLTETGATPIEDEDHASEPLEDGDGLVINLAEDGEGRASSSPEVTNSPGTAIEDEDRHASEPLEDGDGMVTNLPEDGEGRASSSPEVTNSPGTAGTPIEDEDHASEPLEDGDGLVMNLAEDGEGRASSSPEVTNSPGTAIEDEDRHASEPLEDGDGMVTNLPEDGEGRASSSPEVINLPGTAIEDEEHASEPLENGDVMVMNLPTEGGIDSTAPILAPAECSRPRTFVSSFLSKLCRRGGLDNNVGVKVPAGIGKLAVLHTLGVVEVNAQCSKAVFQELKKLTQLRKLGVSGINKGNIHEFCSAISDHAHLKSLSVELDKDDNLDGLDDNIPQPPKTIMSLKLYGRVHKLLAWVWHLNHLERLKLDLTIEKPEELRGLPGLSNQRVLQVGHLRIRPIQDGQLHIGGRWLFHVLEIQCSSELHLHFCCRRRPETIEVLKVHFSSSRGSSLQISGLSHLSALKEVWLKGHSDAHKQHMQRQIDEMELRRPNKERPVLKLVQPRSS